MVQQPTNLEEIASLYASLMQEIKLRTGVLSQLLDNQIPIAPMPAFELCYLQLRKICEIFALACLAAHGDIPQVRTKLVQKTYDADKIIKQLERLNPNFYPVPGKQKKDPITGKVVEVIPIEEDFLTKDGLLKLYGECGNYLHRGSIRQLLTKWQPTIDFDQISNWRNKLINLLNHHQIQLIEPDTQLWVIMQTEGTGEVSAHIMQMTDKFNETVLN